MKVIVKKVNEKAEVIDINITLETLQDLIGGYIEALPLTPDTTLIFDEEGKLKNKKTNIYYINDCIVGDIVIVGNGEEDFTGLNDIQIEKALNIISGLKVN